MIEKIKAVLCSDTAMTAVNVLFFLTLFIIPGAVFIAYTAWIIYLIYMFRKTSSKAVKVITGIFIAFAALMISVNLYALIRY